MPEKKTKRSRSKASPKEEKGDEEIETDGKEDQFIDVSQFFNYQRALNTLIDYLNRSIDDAIAGFTRSDQLLFTHINKKLILNAGLESGFYDFCKYRLAMIAENDAIKDQDEFMRLMTDVQGEIDLLSYLLVNTRLAHRTLTFDVFLSLLKGGLFQDILEVHSRIVKDMEERKQKLNKENIRENVKVDSQFYI